jgi:hypothetical protein
MHLFNTVVAGLSVTFSRNIDDEMLSPHKLSSSLRRFRYVLTGLIVLSLAGCTSITPHRGDVQFTAADLGAPVDLQLCMYKDSQISDRQAADIIAAIQNEFTQYGVIVQVPDIKPWQRPSFNHQGILNDIAKRPLEPPCDRLMALVGRDVRDFLWGALLPEILGAVETRTHTKGFVVAEIGSFNQLMSFRSPAEGAVHEFYHMFGYAHGDDRQTIVGKIVHLKRMAISNWLSGQNFFPGISSQGTLYLSRREVDQRFGLLAATPGTAGLTAAYRHQP